MDRGPHPLTPFKLGWYSFDLGTYRPCDSTYCLYPYESVPPVPELDGTLNWLKPLNKDVDQQMQIYRNAPDARGNVIQIAAEARDLDLSLPDSFLRLMASPDLQDRIPSCTACYFKLAEHIVPFPGSSEGYIIRFLNDQQGGLLWYLYLTAAGEHCALVSPYLLEEYAAPEEYTELNAESRRTVIENTFVCSPSFETFIYRFWLENVIWFKLHGDDEAALTEEEKRYLSHYRHRKTN